MRTLKKGCRGEDVRYLQYILGLTADGSFGPATETSVGLYQARHGLTEDGSVGQKTQKALGLSDFHVHVYDSHAKLWVGGTPFGSDTYLLRTLDEWAKIEDADRVFNLAFFNMNGKGSDKYGTIKGRTLTYVRAKGRDVGYGGTTERIYLDGANAFAGYKLAIKDSQKKPVSYVGKRARCATGRLKDGRFFVVQTVTTATESALVSYMMANYSVDLMLIQDGGGSVGMYDARRDVLIAGEREGKNGRPVATVICVKE